MPTKMLIWVIDLFTTTTKSWQKLAAFTWHANFDVNLTLKFITVNH